MEPGLCFLNKTKLYFLLFLNDEILLNTKANGNKAHFHIVKHREQSTSPILLYVDTRGDQKVR